MGATHQTTYEAEISALQLRVAELEAALQAAHIDTEFAILTRKGIDHRWHQRTPSADTVIFFDIDGLHRHNEIWGYAGTDARIRTVLTQINHFWLFRWFSGDEFGLLCMADDANGYALRVKRLLETQGMTATFGIVTIIDNDLKLSMAKASALVQAAKANGMRGTINKERPSLGSPNASGITDQQSLSPLSTYQAPQDPSQEETRPQSLLPSPSYHPLHHSAQASPKPSFPQHQ
jgi:GGDEF domain-containing protein